MDLRAEFERAIEGMQWKELTSILEEVIQLGNMPNAPSPLPAEPHFSSFPETLGSYNETFNNFLPFEEVSYVQTPAINAAPIPLQPAHLSSQAGAYSQGQFFQTKPNGNVLRSAWALSDESLNETVPTASPLKRSSSIKDQKEEYVKKPPNAFMLFLKEQRPKFAADIKVKGSAIVNTVLGEKWKSLSSEEQAKYFEQANQERRLHEQLHPDWCSKSNYDKKKRKRTRAPANPEVSAPEDTQRAKILCVSPLQTERPSSWIALTEPYQTVWLPQTQINTPPGFVMNNLLQLFDVSSVSAAASSLSSTQNV